MCLHAPYSAVSPAAAETPESACRIAGYGFSSSGYGRWGCHEGDPALQTLNESSATLGNSWVTRGGLGSGYLGLGPLLQLASKLTSTFHPCDALVAPQ